MIEVASLSPEPLDNEEKKVEESLRPVTLSEIIGRKKEKRSLGVMIQSARKRETSLDHILFHGPPGLGKTSLAMVLASEMGVPIHVTTGPAITKAGDLAAIVTNLDQKSILFIDEIHRLRSSVEEILYPAMEDKVLDIVIGKGPSARTLRIDLPEFTIVGATTKVAMVSAPLRDRFGADFRLDFYAEQELAEIVIQKADRMGVKISPEAANEIAGRARMTARIAIRMLGRARDLAVVKDINTIDINIVKEALNMLGVDELGLNDTDRKLLNTIMVNFSNRPVGLSTLAASMSEDIDTLESVLEPFLLRTGLIQRTPRGRVVTEKGEKYLSSLSES